MGTDARSPCIIGVAQRTVRDDERGLFEPLDLWEDVCRRAAKDASARADVLQACESLQITYCHSWQYDSPTRRLAERLGLHPRHEHYSGIGGHTAQLLTQGAAASIRAGEVDVVVLCGAELLASLKHLARAGAEPHWSHPDETAPPFPMPDMHPGELEIDLFTSGPLSFAPWDIARRAHLGIDPDEYRRQLAVMMAPMTEVAAANRYAWFREARNAAFLSEPRPDNRSVAYPYTKHMTAIMEVDMAAAVVVASEEAANRLGVPKDRRVYLHGWCSASDPAAMAEREHLWMSAAMQAASQEAMRCAGVGMDAIAHLDLYSCFPSSINFARDALGIQDRSGDRLTVTGGLPYAGGPASNYVMHSIAAMTDVLRDHPTDFGMVTGLGLLMMKHAFGVYSAAPPQRAPRLPAQKDVQRRLDTLSRRGVVAGFSGGAVLSTYSVLYDRSGVPARGVAVCDADDGARVYAGIGDPDLLAAAERDELVGWRVRLEPVGSSSRIVGVVSTDAALGRN